MSATMQCRNCPGAARDFAACLLPEQRSRLSTAAVSHAYRAHEVLFHECTPALAVHCVRSGSIKLFRRLRNGEEIVVGIRRAGDLVGVRGILVGASYANTAATLEPTVTCSIPAEAFLVLLRENPMLGLRILTRIARESRAVEEQLVERNHIHVAKRTARFLAELFRDPGPGSAGAASMTREEMAQLIGTTPETLSRTLHAFADEGIVALDRRTIRILDRQALLRRAQ